ncbi:MAG TPA: DNA repair protein RecN [Bacteroidota bacterium]|nr:DNA repair protein RecN [Bacteroidota bacterium]
MLRNLSIKNYALIEGVEVEFESGLNILTGETGAGKSIIIDAVSLLLGERATAEVVRKGAEKAIVEGAFLVGQHHSLKKFFEEESLEWQDELIIRREISAKGQSRCFVNDSPVSVSTLKLIGDRLVDLHGQHEHQSLLRAETHIGLLDEFGGLEGLVDEYQESYRELSKLLETLKELLQREKDLKDRCQLYEFQMREIDAVNPQSGEEAELENELRILENAEKLFEATTQLYQLLYEGDQSVYDALVKARNQLEDLASIDVAFEEPQKECASAVAIVGELTKFVQSYNSKIEFNPERLEFIRERLGQFALLKKKYGGSMENVLQQRQKIGDEFALAENFDTELQQLRSAIEEERKRCSTAAQRLSAKRQEIVPSLSLAVCQELAKLGIPHATFDVRIEQKKIQRSEETELSAFVKFGRECYEATSRGIDNVEFYLSANVGEDPQPLVKVASGGEVSRIMLALKTILAKADRLPLLIFDEIDVGISGRIAQAAGRSLKQLSQFHQIIAITHLPQIAGMADCHFVVEKFETDGRTVSVIRKLTDEEHVREVAKLLSGDNVTETSLQSARELIES